MRLLSKVRWVVSRQRAADVNLAEAMLRMRKPYPQVDEQRRRLPEAHPLHGIKECAVEQRLVQLVQGYVHLVFIWLKRRKKGVRDGPTVRKVQTSLLQLWAKGLRDGEGGPTSEGVSIRRDGTRTLLTHWADEGLMANAGGRGSPGLCVPSLKARQGDPRLRGSPMNSSQRSSQAWWSAAGTASYRRWSHMSRRCRHWRQDGGAWRMAEWKPRKSETHSWTETPENTKLEMRTKICHMAQHLKT